MGWCEVERRTKDACLKLAKVFWKGEAVKRIETALAKEEDWGGGCLSGIGVYARFVGVRGWDFRQAVPEL